MSNETQKVTPLSHNELDSFINENYESWDKVKKSIAHKLLEKSTQEERFISAEIIVETINNLTPSLLKEHTMNNIETQDLELEPTTDTPQPSSNIMGEPPTTDTPSHAIPTYNSIEDVKNKLLIPTINSLWTNNGWKGTPPLTKIIKPVFSNPNDPPVDGCFISNFALGKLATETLTIVSDHLKHTVYTVEPNQQNTGFTIKHNPPQPVDKMFALKYMKTATLWQVYSILQQLTQLSLSIFNDDNEIRVAGPMDAVTQLHLFLTGSEMFNEDYENFFKMYALEVLEPFISEPEPLVEDTKNKFNYTDGWYGFTISFTDEDVLPITAKAEYYTVDRQTGEQTVYQWDYIVNLFKPEHNQTQAWISLESYRIKHAYKDWFIAKDQINLINETEETDEPVIETVLPYVRSSLNYNIPNSDKVSATEELSNKNTDNIMVDAFNKASSVGKIKF